MGRFFATPEYEQSVVGATTHVPKIKMELENIALLACVVILFICLLATVFYLLSYLGITGAIKVSVGKPEVQSLWIAYKPHKGPYNKCGPHFTNVVALLPDKSSIGVYYDDPDKVPKDELRYIVGAVLSEEESPPNEIISLVKKYDFQIAQFPKIDFAVKAKFPFHFDLCALIGAWRVYPRLASYINEGKLSAYPFIEICKGSFIHYMAPLSKQNDFFVPEIKHEPSRSTESSEGHGQADTTDDDTQSSTSSFEEINALEKSN